MAATPQPGETRPTIGQIFQQKGLWAWFSSPVTNHFDGQSERGQDYSTTFGTPVGVAVGGTIVRIVHNNNAINDIVELQDSSGAVWLYQHITSKVKVGQVLGCGGIIGTENGLPIDQYSTGPHIEVRYCPAGKWSMAVDSWFEPWVNPQAIFAALAGQVAGAADVGNGVSAAVAKAAAIFSPNEDMPTFLSTLDTALDLQNPFNSGALASGNPTFDLSVGPLSAQVPDPVGWASDVLENMVQDMAAGIVRVCFILLGIAIFVAVEQAYIQPQISKMVENSVGGTQGIAQIAGALL